MNKRFFKDTITVYNELSDGTYQRTTIKNVYFDKNKKTVVTDNGILKASSGTIVIPTSIATINDILAIKSYIDTKSLKRESAILNFTLNAKLIDSPWTLFDNDYIVDGETDKEFDFRELSKEHRLFRISTVQDNRKGNLQHFELELKE